MFYLAFYIIIKGVCWAVVEDYALLCALLVVISYFCGPAMEKVC